MSSLPSSNNKFQPPKPPPKSTAKSSNSGAGVASSAQFGTAGIPKKTGPTGATGAAGKANTVQVIYNGKIVTPQSLIPNRPSAAQAATAKVTKGHQVTSIPENESLDKQGPMKQFKKAGTMNPEVGITAAPSRFGHSSMFGSNSATTIDKAKLEERCVVVLTETATETILNMNSHVFASDLREVSVITDKNKVYDALKERRIKDADSFACKQTQTLNHVQKSQHEMAAPAPTQTFGNQVTAYEITDATGINRKHTVDAETSMLNSVSADATVAGGVSQGVGTDGKGNVLEGAANFGVSVQRFIEDTVNVSLATPGCLLDVEAVNKEKYNDRKEGGKGNKKGVGTGTTGTSTGPPPTVSMAANTTNVSASGVNASGGGGGGGGSGSNFFNNATTATAANAVAPNASNSSDPNNNSGNNSASFSHAGAGHAGPSHGSGGAAAPGDNAQDSAQILFEKQAADIMKSSMLLKRLQMIERAVQQNAYHRNQLDYRDLPDVPPLKLASRDRAAVVEDENQLFGGLGGGLRGLNNIEFVNEDEEKVAGTEEAAENPEGTSNKVKKLFNFYFADLVQGRSVTALAWNSVNNDLLAVGYGKVDQFADPPKLGEAVDEQLQGGLVLFWSLRNPEYPEKILRTPHPVTALDFSITSPMLLALGQLNGDVCIYDMLKNEDINVPKETSESIKDATLTHSDPVWQLRWVVRGIEKNETLVSISTDGAVLEWNLKKGLAVSTLMHLKRSGMGEGWISRQAAGLCFDFVPDDPGQSTYVVGTEEGSLHKCSVSYNEQYLETYAGHNGPLYRVRFSRHCPQLFLTCSADWSMGLYDIRHKDPLAIIRSSGEDFSINDICWCPGNSTVFAAVTADARLQIWDLQESCLDPVESYDTSVDDVTITQKEELAEANKDDGRATSANTASKPNTATAASRYESRFDRREEEKEPPVARLMRNLNQKDASKRMLTSVLFGARSPTVVVGDSRGSVTVYRIFDPLTITHDGPLQQAEKLQRYAPKPNETTSSANSNSATH